MFSGLLIEYDSNEESNTEDFDQFAGPFGGNNAQADEIRQFSDKEAGRLQVEAIPEEITPCEMNGEMSVSLTEGSTSAKADELQAISKIELRLFI